MFFISISDYPFIGIPVPDPEDATLNPKVC